MNEIKLEGNLTETSITGNNLSFGEILANTREIIPDPVSLIESMRAVGYSVETAIADLIDNSITANAKNIHIAYDASEEPFVAILDDGDGMSKNKLENAMQHGSTNPNDLRDSNDLGRFGLGLKTASHSQCKKLTVVTKCAGEIHALCWDLDVVREKKGWFVVVPDETDIAALPLFETLNTQYQGTLVVWQNLDRLMSESSAPQQEMTAKMSPLMGHLSFVFHRFTQREDFHSVINIIINGLPIKPMDPFLSGNHFRQPLEGQSIQIRNESITVRPYVLPPISHLTIEEIELAGGKDGLRRSQGFYIYRNRRLVIWGTWFRLVPKDEFYKLTRVQVDIPNSLDDLWALDIKKSAAYPPDIIRNKLRNLIPHFANVSRKAITYPGRRTAMHVASPVWNRIEPRHGKFSYELNTEHEVIANFANKLDPLLQKEFTALINLVGWSLPFQAIYADMCADTPHENDSDTVSDLVSHAQQIIDATQLKLQEILKLDPFVRYPHLHELITKEVEI